MDLILFYYTFVYPDLKQLPFPMVVFGITYSHTEGRRALMAEMCSCIRFCIVSLCNKKSRNIHACSCTEQELTKIK